MSKSLKTAVDELYKSKEDLLIVGLTGRTGAGCSTVADLLSRDYESLDIGDDNRLGESEADIYKKEIVRSYMSQEDHWIPFEKIEGSSVIVSYIFENYDTTSNHPSDSLVNYIRKLQEKDGDKETDSQELRIENEDLLIQAIYGLDDIYEKVREFPLNKLYSDIDKMDDDDILKYYQLYIVDMPRYKKQLKNILELHHCSEIKRKKLQTDEPVQYHLYTFLLQKIGNNIRSSGEPFVENFVQDKFLAFAERIDLFIKLICCKNGEGKKTRICIDAIRNANESNYIKNAYRNYYLISISVDEEKRLKRLESIGINEVHSIDKTEYSGDYKAEAYFYQQNISQCFEMADIHLYNEECSTEHKYFLTDQILRYVALMIHPGLVTPTHFERCMQLAFNAKYNSGCLSRQVGAVITGEDFSIRAVGWNDVPHGQVTCNLRDLETCLKELKQDCFSQYELGDDFRKTIKSINDELDAVSYKGISGGRKYPFCFKDIFNGYTGERNQVHTRSLHAEENAFLQISKYGGQGIKGGKLFVTASPCELCSKKSFQLGIKEIYYIDPYPGIAERNIINSGEKELRPRMHVFYGAIGEAYISLYRPIMPYKDEIELISGINPRKVAQNGGESTWREPKTDDFYFKSVEFSIEFKSREAICCKRTVNGLVKNGSHEYIDKRLVWTGKTHDSTILTDGDGKLELMDSNPGAPIRYRIIFDSVKKKGDIIKYTIETDVHDETHIMHPYIANVVRCPTDILTLRIIDNGSVIDSVKYRRYADREMEVEFTDIQNVIDKTIDGHKEYTLVIKNPNLFYTYSLEWKFIK